MFEDVVDLGTELFDNFKDFNAGRAVTKGREFIRGHVNTKLIEGVGGDAAKKANKIPLVVKGGNIVLDTLGIDKNQTIRNRVKEFTGSIDASDILDADDVARAETSANDNGHTSPSADKMITGQIDP